MTGPLAAMGAYEPSAPAERASGSRKQQFESERLTWVLSVEPAGWTKVCYLHLIARELPVGNRSKSRLPLADGQ